ncbi:MAG TPA: flavin reductase family protein [Clostridiales bacterium]|nr:flavin reductase family protein [Clostridiales bacterium]
MCEKSFTGENNVKHVPYDLYLKEVTEQLTHKGIFLTTCGEKDNTMIIGWGGITYFWNKPIFLVPVRYSRYTWQNINSTNVFTVSIPLNKDMKEAINYCGTKSGRDVDKFKECGLTPVPGKFVQAPIIGECSLHYECRVVFKQSMEPVLLDEKIKNSSYRNNDYHTMFYGEIVACYLTE